jgi:hypothetical protein
MMAYSFDMDLSVDGWDIKIDPAADYGYFEWVGGDNTDPSCTGGLWFDRNEQGLLRLLDYDGVMELPRPVVAALKDALVDLADMIAEGV